MAAGLVSHNITTASGVTFGVVSWVPNTAAPDVGAVPVARITDGASVAPVDATNGLAVQLMTALPAGSNAIGKLAANAGVNVGTVSVDATQLATLATAFDILNNAGGGQKVYLPTDQPWPKGLSNRAFSVAFATLTRPANTTAYAAADSISDNATAGSVTALVSGNIGDVNDDPLFISDIVIKSTDTGLAGKRIRAYVYNSDPTVSSGVGGGDNAAFSNKIAGYVGSFSGTLETGFSDGTVGRLVPSFNDSATAPVPNVGAGGFIAVKPVSGAKTLYVQYQTLDAFTPSANSTTIIGTIRGWQGRAA